MSTLTLTDVPGFRATGVICGLKTSGKPDLALVMADKPCQWAAVFTTNAFQAAPVLYDRALLTRSGGQNLRGVLINAGIANACTGTQGAENAARMAHYAETRGNLTPNSIFVMSTGVIGHQLPMDKVEQGIEAAFQKLSPEGGYLAAEAIMTTDTVPKTSFIQVELDGNLVSIGGMAKGSGMIHPNMATMLATIVTDAHLTPADLNTALRHAINQSFNRVSVDGDTSTNDTVIILANGQSHPTPLTGPALNAFTVALTSLCTDLAKMIARDGEGATKLIEIQLQGAQSDAEAATAAATLATSPLSKTALFGNDPNWGRFLGAIGRSGIQVNPEQTSLWLETVTQKTQLVDCGQPLTFDAVALHHALAESAEVTIIADIGMGIGKATYWTCDFSYKYVEINAEYHT